jgi:predicted transglutaminase-like cysteine proteinase
MHPAIEVEETPDAPDRAGPAMMRWISVSLLVPIVATALVSGAAAASGRRPAAALIETSPSLAPFQHVRFCLRYPADCRSNPAEDERIQLTDDNSQLLDRVNHEVNAAIGPGSKSYGKNLREGWTIAPLRGDCNDYAVTKRHELLRSGLPAKALRLAVVVTKSEGGHLVLLVATTKGNLVLDNLTDEIVPWQTTDYQWLKIQSARDAKAWYEVKASGHPCLSSVERCV